MADFNRNRRGVGRDFSRGGFRDRGPVEMHRAVCDNCGKDCEVPFRPTQGKPIFCSNCFESRKGSDTGRFENRDFRRSSNSEERQMFDAVCDNCGNNCSVPFRPSGDKPIYCSDCFGEKKGAGDRGAKQPQPQNNNQLEMLNSKLDRILQLLEPKQVVQVVEEEIVIEEVEEKAKTETKPKPAKKRSPKKKSNT